MKLGILVSGGDSPGINAVIYGAFEAASRLNVDLVGITGGFKGILDKNFVKLKGLNAELIQAAGSILPTGRFNDFKEESVRAKVIQVLKDEKIDGLVVVGGNGSLAGAQDLDDMGFPVIGVPATVDGDVFATQNAVGFATAVQVATESLHALHSTSAAYPGRIFLLETLGGKKGYLALVAGLAAGADIIVLPETASDQNTIAEKVKDILAEKGSVVGVVCEGASPTWCGGDQNYITELGLVIEKATGVRVRYSVMGYGLRGEKPVYEDCLLGRWCGNAAVAALSQGKSGLIAGEKSAEKCLLPLDKNTGGFPVEYWLDLAKSLDVPCV